MGKVSLFQERNMRSLIYLTFYLMVDVSIGGKYLSKIYCKDHEDSEEHDSCGPTVDHDRKCSFIVDTQDAKCSDLRVHMDRNYSEPFNLRLYFTQNECTIPSMGADQSDDFVLLAENLNVSPVNKSVSMESVSMENLCGLVNLVLVMSNSSEPYIEHLVTPVFINCSSIDFKVEVKVGGDSNNSIEIVTPGESNPFKKTKFRITTGGSNQTTTTQCQPKAIMCMICDMDHEELEMFHESEEIRMAWQGMIASSKFSDRIKGWSSCVPMHEGSLEISEDNIVDMTNVTIPCDHTIYQESLCGVITYVDPMEKCMDMNITNNLVITPVYVNSSDCYQDYSGQCSTHIDFMKKGGKNAAVVKGDMFAAIIKPGGIVPSDPWHEYIKKLKGMQRVLDFYETSQCQDKCTSMYNKEKQEFDAIPKLSYRLISTLKLLLDKFDTADSNVYYMSSLVRSVLTCIEEDPKTCPFKNDVVENFVHLVKKAMVGKPRWKSASRQRRQLKTDGDKTKDWRNDKTGDDYNGAKNGQNGEEVCEGHGFSEGKCVAIGCCHWNDEVSGTDNNCWSSVGQESCLEEGTNWGKKKKERRNQDKNNGDGNKKDRNERNNQQNKKKWNQDEEDVEYESNGGEENGERRQKQGKQRDNEYEEENSRDSARESSERRRKQNKVDTKRPRKDEEFDWEGGDEYKD